MLIPDLATAPMVFPMFLPCLSGLCFTNLYGFLVTAVVCIRKKTHSFQSPNLTFKILDVYILLLPTHFDPESEQHTVQPLFLSECAKRRIVYDITVILQYC